MNEQQFRKLGSCRSVSVSAALMSWVDNWPPSYLYVPPISVQHPASPSNITTYRHTNTIVNFILTLTPHYRGFYQFPVACITGFPYIRLANFNWTLCSLLWRMFTHPAKLMSWVDNNHNIVCLRLCNKITLNSVCLLRNWRRKYANDFANELPRWTTDYLEPVQLSQWRWPELNTTSVLYACPE